MLARYEPPGSSGTKGEVMRYILACVAISSITLSTAALAKEDVPLSIEAIVAGIEVKNDPLDQFIKVSTFNVVRERYAESLAKNPSEALFMRAFIDKKTREATYQVYRMTSSSRGWDFFKTASFEDKDGPSVVPVKRTGSDASCFRSGCRTYEDVIFEVPVTTLEWVVSDPAKTEWRYKISAESGKVIEEPITVREISAILQTVKRVQAER